MLKILVFVAALMGLSIAMSTKEQRADARARMARYSTGAWLLAAAGLAFLLWA